MILRRSRFLHQVPVGDGRVMLLHAASQLRLVVGADVAAVVDYFAGARSLPEDYPGLAARVTGTPEAILGCVQALTEHGLLTQKTPDEELAELSAVLASTHGRDPEALLDQHRRALKQGGESYWAAGAAQGIADLGQGGRRIEAILMGDCDLQMEADFLRQEAALRGIDLRIAATFPDDLRLAAEHRHDVILVGALRARHRVTDPLDPVTQAPPYGPYIAEAQNLLDGLRQHSAAPILIDNLPEPTVQPLGLAERGLNGHRNRFRLANAALAELADSYSDVHVVDIAAALGAAGAERLLDDGQVGFTHFGSPGWLLQRPETEKAAVHGLFPDIAPLAAQVGGDPYLREKALARAHVDALVAALGVDRKKCVIVDLDGVLWPGVLAETGAPFAWAPDVSGDFSYIGLFFGLHEALLALKRRGILLACVSKNDEETVRALWTWPDHYPRERLLTPDDFVTWRVNWEGKVENIASIAEELGFALETFLFIDDHPIERDRVRQRLPQVEVWGEDPFALRRRLLEDPRLQPPKVTGEAAARTGLVRAQLDRDRLRKGAVSEADYLASLDIRVAPHRLQPGEPVDRIEELFQRTTQFNTTGRRFPAAELAALAAREDAAVFSMAVADRFGDHGLVGAVVMEAGEITGFALSCRVLGLGVEHRFLQHVIEALRARFPVLQGRIVPTDRNRPVRNLYRDNGFAEVEPGVWRIGG
ncbi:MAG: HAD-IIIC family phosphatase [Caulobacteraceae bacterium]|nr:HAD-IIIC family phosphatase [Caulobacteraceae bacterium]